MISQFSRVCAKKFFRVHEADCAAVDDVRDVKVVRDVRGGARPASPACPACLQLNVTPRAEGGYLLSPISYPPSPICAKRAVRGWSLTQSRKGAENAEGFSRVDRVDRVVFSACSPRSTRLKSTLGRYLLSPISYPLSPICAAGALCGIRRYRAEAGKLPGARFARLRRARRHIEASFMWRQSRRTAFGRPPADWETASGGLGNLWKFSACSTLMTNH